jgi:cell wall-associated NlpC family hydrolase
MLGGRLTLLTNSTRGFLALGGALLLTSTLAHADVYHAVATGDTISSIAKQYGVSAGALKAANGLKESDNSPLGAMLLRVPTKDNGGANVSNLASPAPVASPNNSSFGNPTYSPPVARTTSRPATASTGSGTLSQTISETVRQGDTWETIAARYAQAGYDVNADDIKRRNSWMPLPAAGQQVVVPLGQVSVSAPNPNLAPRIAANTPVFPRVAASAQTSPKSAREPRALGGGVYDAEEVRVVTPSTSPTTVAKDVSQTKAPVFNAPNGGNHTASRGTLPSRGGYGQLARTAQGADIRVLSPTEEATAPPASRASVATNPVAQSAPVAKANIAKVAKVVSNGAQIRRLPQSSAVTLYKCAIGTQLAVLRQSGTWSAVLMSDRSTGWVPTSSLKLTGSQVDVSTQIANTDGPGGSARWSVGRYTTESPTVAHALTWMGTPYRYGGTTRRGIDCSALVQRSFAVNGIKLPRTAATQANVGQAIAPADLKAGDRLYFSASGTRIDHTGLYMGDGLFVHASGSGRQVIVSNLFTPRNWNIFVGARR